MSFFLFNSQAQTAGVYNVKNYGATGDGSTDDTSAIQAAITASSNNGVILFPKGNYKTISPIAIPSGSSLSFVGTGNGSIIQGNFNGFVFDNLSDPYNAVGAISSFENLSITNNFVGNRFSMPTGGTWSASGSPTTILLSGSNPGVAAGGALWMTGGVNSVFIGMITSVTSWPTVTVSSAAAASADISGGGLTAQIIQCYAAGGSFSAHDATITMATTRPAGIGTGLYYVYDYERYLADPRTDFPIGVASWSGTTVTFVPQSSPRDGALLNSVGTSDRLWFAPVAGCIRYSSVVGAKVTNCFISGFYGVTTSEDKTIANDTTAGSAQGFHVLIDTCTFSNPSGFSGLMGQTGVYLTNNSIAINSNSSGLWCAERLSGTNSGIIGGRAEVNHFGIIIGGDFTTSNGSLSGGFIIGRSMESNLQAIYCKGGGVDIISSGCSCNALASTVLGGFYLNGFTGVVENSGATGNFGSQYAIYVADAGTLRGKITFVSASASNFSTPSQSWRIPAQAWWGTCIQSDNPALVYTYANLTGVGANPVAVEGDEFNISDGTNGLGWGDTAINTGTHTTHYKVRYNGTNWTVVGK